MGSVRSIFERINATLREQYDDVASEPLPKRWIDLITYLNQKERANRSAETRPNGTAEAKPKPQRPD